MVRVRPGRPEDAEAIVAVNAAGWRSAFRGIVDDDRIENLPIDRWREEISNGLARPQSFSFTLVGELEGGFAGYCFVSAPGRDQDLGRKVAELVAIYVEPPLWRRGVGRALIAAAERGAAERGFHQMSAWTFKGNQRALAFYEASGWDPDGGERLHPEAGAEAIRLRKRVASAQ